MEKLLGTMPSGVPVYAQTTSINMRDVREQEEFELGAVRDDGQGNGLDIALAVVHARRCGSPGCSICDPDPDSINSKYDLEG